MTWSLNWRPNGPYACPWFEARCKLFVCQGSTPHRHHIDSIVGNRCLATWTLDFSWVALSELCLISYLVPQSPWATYYFRTPRLYRKWKTNTLHLSTQKFCGCLSSAPTPSRCCTRWARIGSRSTNPTPNIRPIGWSLDAMAFEIRKYFGDAVWKMFLSRSIACMHYSYIKDNCVRHGKSNIL